MAHYVQTKSLLPSTNFAWRRNMTWSCFQRTAKALFCVAILGLALNTARAADTNGRIKGTVTDATNAVIPGATVTATNVQTGHFAVPGGFI